MNDKEEHIILIKRSVHQKGITILNVYRLDKSISKKKKKLKQKLTELNGERDSRHL